MSFLGRLRGPRMPKTAEEKDALALRQLRKLGADLSKPRHMIHVLYFPSEETAHDAADRIRRTAWYAIVEPPTEPIDEWSVRVEGERVVAADSVSAFRSWFEHIAAELGGDYDGWEAAAKP
jgi:regulator of ribonuclease activity B